MQTECVGVRVTDEVDIMMIKSLHWRQVPAVLLCRGG